MNKVRVKIMCQVVKDVNEAMLKNEIEVSNILKNILRVF